MTTEELIRSDGLLFHMARLGSATAMLQRLEALTLSYTDWPEDLKSFREKKKHRRRLICERAIELRQAAETVRLLVRDEVVLRGSSTLERTFHDGVFPSELFKG